MSVYPHGPNIPSLMRHAQGLAAPLIKESHDSHLDPDAMTVNQITIAVLPYAGMANGDVVRLHWQGTCADGTAGPAVNPAAKTLSDADTDSTNNPGQVLSWTVAKTSAVALRGGKIDLYYEITYVSSSSTQADSVSAQRTFQVAPSVTPELQAPSIRDLIGSEINPGQFPEGIQVVVPPWPGMLSGDDLLVYGTGSAANKNTISYLKIDPSHIGTGLIEVPIPLQWLLDNSGGEVTLRYQYARADATGSSIPVELMVSEPLVLPTPTVDGSVVSSGRDELNPIMAISGASITIPPAALFGDEYEVTAYWRGFGASGTCEVQEPSTLNPMKFKVPASVIPPNFGKTVEVTYSVGRQYADAALQLFIRELGNHPGIECEHAQIGSPATLKRSDIPEEGVWVSVGLWPFISTAHIVRLWLTASGIADRDIIAARQVTSEESTGGVKGRLLQADVAGVAPNANFTLKVSVSFDGGHSTVVFNRPLILKLLD